MSHKKLVSHGVAKCQLKTQYCGYAGELTLLTSLDGCFQAFVCDLRIGDVIAEVNGNEVFRKKFSVAYVELGTHAFSQFLEFQTLLKKYEDNVDSVVRNSLWSSEFGNFAWAVRSYISKERAPRAFFYDSISTDIIESFLVHATVFRQNKYDSPLNVDWVRGRKCLSRTMESWREGQAHRHWTA